MGGDDRAWRAGPLWKLRNIASENSVVHLEENNTKSDGLVGGIELELGMDVDSEGRDHGREQTSQRARGLARVVKLTTIRIIFKSSLRSFTKSALLFSG